MVGGGTTVRGEELFEAGCLFCVHILQGLDIIIKVQEKRIHSRSWMSTIVIIRSEQKCIV